MRRRQTADPRVRLVAGDVVDVLTEAGDVPPDRVSTYPIYVLQRPPHPLGQNGDMSVQTESPAA
ncbi:MAG: hypothetical protein ACLGIF_10825, partial [Actinomycetes bacterium]